MLTIYFNEKPLILCDVAASKQFVNDEKTLRGRFLNVKTLYSYIDLMEKPHQFDQVVLFSENFDRLSKEFIDLFKVIEAAGGVVKNANGDILFIFRRGFWDLPKGKIDKGESKEAAAVREVQEETGLQQVDLQDFVMETFHVYEHKGKRILKKTYWYNMVSSDIDLVPQAEEDIDLAVWRSKASFLTEETLVFANILAILEKV